MVLGCACQPGKIGTGYGTITRYGLAFQPSSPTVLRSSKVSHDPPRASHDPDSTTRDCLTCCRFRLTPVRSPLLGGSLLLSLRPGTEMFQFPGCPPGGYVFTTRYSQMNVSGLPHSEIIGSWPACGSPMRFVARHVLPRHWLPEHPPYALRSLTNPPVRPLACEELGLLQA